jgi:hypothetical protein
LKRKHPAPVAHVFIVQIFHRLERHPGRSKQASSEELGGRASLEASLRS